MSSEISDYQVHGNIAVITIDSPPVNALGIEVRKCIVAGIEKADLDANVRAIILTCAGRTFHAGADIKEFGKPPLQPDLSSVVSVVESTSKITVAAMHGTALGGGLELSLACHRRVALSTTKVGFPEVNLGILPGCGGTQKLPRIVGAEKALNLIGSGRMVSAKEALDLGILDQLTEKEDLLAAALEYTQGLIADDEPLLRPSERSNVIKLDRDKPEIFEQYLKANARKFRGFQAPLNIVKSIEAAITLPIDQGIKRERELVEELFAGTQSGAQRHVFFAERETSKIPDIPKTTPVRDIQRVAVIGAGTMGGGIAMNFLNAGIPVTLLEQKQDALERGINVIRKNYQRSVKSGRLSQKQLDERMAMIVPRLDMSELVNADLIIEAVFEEMSVKKDVFANIDKIAKPGCILASNTSYLDLNEIAAATKRPEDVIGMHFFSPANVMPLLEVVRGTHSSLDAINTAMRLSKTIKKTPVLSRTGWGFIANRVMKMRAIQAGNMILQGVSPQDIDRVIYDYGFSMGPFAVKDLVGLDVTNRDVKERTVETVLVSKDRVIAEIAAENNIEQIPADDDEIIARLLYPIVNEGAKVLDEGIAIRSSDIDIACIKGYNWPTYHGGPMYWANAIGLDTILNKLYEFEQRFGEAFTPSPYLVNLVNKGEQF